MVTLRTIQSLGYSTEFFKLPLSNTTFYTFDSVKPSRQPSYWNLVGINQEEKTAQELQFLYIDEEALLHDAFSATRDANSFLSLSIDELQTLITFLESRVDVKTVPVEGKSSHFTVMHEVDLAELHFDKQEIQQNIGNYYSYHPVPSLQASEKMSIIGLPSWQQGEKIYSLDVLAVATFDRQRLNDSAFHLMDAEWLGSIKLDTTALSEFVFLLKQRARRVISLSTQKIGVSKNEVASLVVFPPKV